MAILIALGVLVAAIAGANLLDPKSTARVHDGWKSRPY